MMNDEDQIDEDEGFDGETDEDQTEHEVTEEVAIPPIPDDPKDYPEGFSVPPGKIFGEAWDDFHSNLVASEEEIDPGED